MASCELCGRPAVKKAKVEGTILSVCASCGSFGTEIKEAKPFASVKTTYSLKAEQTETFLAPDFGNRLRQARLRLQLSEEDAAKKLNIKESTLKHYEAGKVPPDDAAIKKLEKFYSISIVQHL